MICCRSDCVCCMWTGACPLDHPSMTVACEQAPASDHPSMTVSVVCEQVPSPVTVCCVQTGAHPQTSSIHDCLLCEQVPASDHPSMTVSVVCAQVPAPVTVCCVRTGAHPRHHPSMTVCYVNRCLFPSMTVCCVWRGACPHSWLSVVCVLCKQVPAPRPHPSVTHWLCVLCVWTGARPQTSSILEKLSELQASQEELKTKKQQLAAIEAELASLRKAADKWVFANATSFSLPALFARQRTSESSEIPLLSICPLC